MIQIEYSDVGGQHIEVRTDGTIRLYGTKTDGDNGCIIVDEKQARILKAIIAAESEIQKVMR